jgi:hypothetical protein
MEKINLKDLNLTTGRMKVCDTGKNWFLSNFPEGGTFEQINNAIDSNFNTKDLVGRAQRMEWKRKIKAVKEKKNS